MNRGLVIKSTGKWCQVLAESGDRIDCVIRGKFRMAGIRTTNPLAVGDRVGFEMQDDGTGLVLEIEERRNYIIRRSVNLSKEAHIIASNVDLAFLVVTLAEPPTSYGFIDRFLAAAEAYNIDVCILFNKVDIYGQVERAALAEYVEVYKRIGYLCIEVSAITGVNLDEVRSLMKDKVSMFSGHSGVGKSTLINTLQPGLEIKTSGVSDYHGKGTHTTTFAEMHALDMGGFIIDTPGIKGFGLVDMPKEEIHHYFREMFALLPECKFHNCMHLNEPGCAVKKAVENGSLAESRYRSYSMMMEDSESTHYRV